MENNEYKKSLSPMDYFDTLQQEYIIAEFRRSIYYNPKSKKYFKRIMEYKKEKILNMSKVHNLESIFSNKELMKKFKEKFYGSSNAMPIFSSLNKEDVKMYYLPNQEVIVDTEEGKKAAKILRFSFNYSKVQVTFKEENAVEHWFSMGKVKRILFSENLFF